MTARSLAGATVAVVGASGGLGAPITRHLAARGAEVVLAGRDRARLEAVAPGADTTTVVLDIRDPTAGDILVAAVTGRHGHLDGLVNAAGIVAFGTLAETPDEVIEELFLTNVLGPLWLTRRVAPLLGASKGFLVNVSAVVAEAPLPGMVAYGATKAALTSADAALTRELRRSGITVVDVRPPHTETGLAGRAVAGQAPRLPVGLDPDAVAARIVQAITDGEPDVASAAFGT